MKLLIVSSSQREGSQSAKVAQYLYDNNKDFNEVNHLELCRYALPFWNGDSHTKSQDSSTWPFISQQVKQADALILITPEWGGMASPLLKNFLLMCDNQDTAHKPALLMSVVSGISGAYPIAELRMNALKNNKLVATPDHLIIRNVTEVLNTQAIASERDKSIKERIDYSTHMLHQYAKALFSIRQQHSATPYPKQQEYAYGM
ncbi:NAD(P)H-dependent oxidoreductase [uncultured Shewanella sp.]|uniref:NADPH-dependent FMN reductase n=1 Tax=uncultured Shewanella sp. TaxID=173975 RepID=UPI0026093700|nr:NAD(P)H-dependent oxidoreductase [uncultured Shewanella sp.]